MIEYYKIYLPKSKREVKIEISVPRIRENIKFDTIYMLDGQNAFKDSHASFGKAIGAAKSLGIAAKELGKRILGVAIYNSESDMGRINEYTPFKIERAAYDSWLDHDTTICENYCYDFINTIIPFVENRYSTYKSAEHRFIYGSSLAAITAMYLGVKYPDSFNYIGSFSTASFLFDKEYFEFLDSHELKKKNVFLYVGKKEQSDDIYDTTVYYDTAMKIYKYMKNRKVRVRLVIDPQGEHNEATWERHFFDFINFIYNDDIIVSKN